LERGIKEGDNPVQKNSGTAWIRVGFFTSRVVWECSPKLGGKFHLKLNIGERPIAYKYREGKMQRTLKRELKVLEIVKREAIEAPPFLKRLWRNSAYLFQWFLSWPWIERGDHNFWKGGWRGQLFFFFFQGEWFLVIWFEISWFELNCWK